MNVRKEPSASGGVIGDYGPGVMKTEGVAGGAWLYVNGGLKTK